MSSGVATHLSRRKLATVDPVECLLNSQLAALVDGSATPELALQLDAHVDLCADCRDLLVNLVRGLAPSSPSLLPSEQEAPDTPPFLRFDPEALEAFTEWRTGFEAELRTGDLYPALESHLAKYRKLVPALTLAFHLADGHHGPVGFASTLRALHWSVYLQTHARRCYGVAQSGEKDTARRILERIARGDLLRR